MAYGKRQTRRIRELMSQECIDRRVQGPTDLPEIELTAKTEHYVVEQRETECPASYEPAMHYRR